MESLKYGISLLSAALVLVVLFLYYLRRRSKPAETSEKPRTQTTEEKYTEVIYEYLRCGAHLNHTRLGFRYKIEISKPELVGGPDNGATKVSVMWGRCDGDLHSVLDVEVDGDYVDVKHLGVRVRHPVPSHAKYDYGELNRLGFILADFAQNYAGE